MTDPTLATGKDEPPTDFDVLNQEHPWVMFWANLAQGIDDALHGGGLRFKGDLRCLWRGIRKRRSYP